MTGVNCLSDNLKRLFWNFKTALFDLVYIYSKCKKLKTDITFSFLSSKWLDCCACATGLSPTNVTLFWASQIPNQTKRVRQTISLSKSHHTNIQPLVRFCFDYQRVQGVIIWRKLWQMFKMLSEKRKPWEPHFWREWSRNLWKGHWKEFIPVFRKPLCQE